MEAYKCELKPEREYCEHRRNQYYRNPFTGEEESAPYCLMADRFISDLKSECPDVKETE